MLIPRQSDLPSTSIPMFLQILFAYCEDLLKRAYNLNRFSLQMIHVSRAIRHVIICLLQGIGDVDNNSSGGFGAAVVGGDLADHLRMARIYSRALQT
jgi:hypothetical protein